MEEVPEVTKATKWQARLLAQAQACSFRMHHPFRHKSCGAVRLTHNHHRDAALPVASDNRHGPAHVGMEPIMNPRFRYLIPGTVSPVCLARGRRTSP